MGHSSGYRDFFTKKNDFWIQSNGPRPYSRSQGSNLKETRILISFCYFRNLLTYKLHFTKTRREGFKLQKLFPSDCIELRAKKLSEFDDRCLTFSIAMIIDELFPSKLRDR